MARKTKTPIAHAILTMTSGNGPYIGGILVCSKVLAHPHAKLSRLEAAFPDELVGQIIPIFTKRDLKHYEAQVADHEKIMAAFEARKSA